MCREAHVGSTSSSVQECGSCRELCAERLGSVRYTHRAARVSRCTRAEASVRREWRPWAKLPAALARAP